MQILLLIDDLRSEALKHVQSMPGGFRVFQVEMPLADRAPYLRL